MLLDPDSGFIGRVAFEPQRYGQELAPTALRASEGKAVRQLSLSVTQSRRSEMGVRSASSTVCREVRSSGLETRVSVGGETLSHERTKPRLVAGRSGLPLSYLPTPVCCRAA